MKKKIKEKDIIKKLYKEINKLKKEIKEKEKIIKKIVKKVKKYKKKPKVKKLKIKKPKIKKIRKLKIKKVKKLKIKKPKIKKIKKPKIKKIRKLKIKRPPIKVKRKKKIEIKDILKKVERVKKFKKTRDWVPMYEVLNFLREQYGDFSMDKDSALLIDKYRYRGIKYYKLISKVPKLKFKKKVRKYKVYALLRVKTPSPSDTLETNEYVLKSFIWENKKFSTRELLKRLLGPSEVQGEDEYRTRLDSILSANFMMSERYIFVEFVGLELE